MRQDLAQAQQALSIANGQIRNLEQVVSGLQQQNASLTENVNKLTVELNQSQARCAELDSALHSAEGQINNLQT